MTRIKLCGLSRSCDIEAANAVKPEYIGFVFAPKSKRYVTPDKARQLKAILSPDIKAVGVFVNESADTVAELLEKRIIDIAQLHGSEDETYFAELRKQISRPIIKVFPAASESDVERAEQSTAEYILFDSGAGSGTVFDWSLLQKTKRPYFLAGGLTLNNVADAIKSLHPYAVDISSGIETDGVKDKTKMAAFVAAVREEDSL